jgi:hypothetical protein
VTVSPVTSPTNLTSQTITGTVEAGAIVNVATDTSASDGAATVSGTIWSYNITGLVEEVNNITITAVDTAGNSTTVTSSITLDTITPNTSITNQPSNLSNSASATFEFTSTKSNSIFQCQLDNSVYSACISPKSYSGITDGSHTFYVKATDTAGNTDPTPETYTWTVDTISPITTTSPKGGTFTSAQSVTLSCNDGTGSGCNKTYYLDSNDFLSTSHES